MNCIYCQQIADKVSTINSIEGQETAYHCERCRSWQHYLDGILYKGAVFIRCHDKEFVFFTYLQPQTSEVCWWDPAADKFKDVFTLNHIPDWTPTNLVTKIERLLIFS